MARSIRPSRMDLRGATPLHFSRAVETSSLDTLRIIRPDDRHVNTVNEHVLQGVFRCFFSEFFAVR